MLLRLFPLVVVLCGLLAVPVLAQKASPPAVLFAGGVHAKYVANPLHHLGLEVDACTLAQLPERLDSGKYNVVVIGTTNAQVQPALDAFLAKGGGVLATSPEANFHNTANWVLSNQWLAAHGARPRFEIFYEENKANLLTDVLGQLHSYSQDVQPPFNDGVRSLLTHAPNRDLGGGEWPTSFDLTPAWRVIARGAATLKTRPSKLNMEHLQAWIPKDERTAPPLLAIREDGKGRMAALAIRYGWLFTPPTNCPTSEVMLTAGTGGKPSDWLRLLANTMRWLAEPSLQAGLGGATTPADILNPPKKLWPDHDLVDWTQERPHKFVPPLNDLPQLKGLVGARTALSSGTGTVADYVKEAKAAGLDYLVFLEDALKMDQAKYDQLVQQCKAASGAEFAAIPGLTIENAQGDHYFLLSDNVKFPKPDMVLPDGRLATTTVSRTEALFAYIIDYHKLRTVIGYWRHKENYLHFSDYKLYNAFPIYSFEDGKPIDSAFDEFLTLQGIGGCQSVFALEMMTNPAQVAKRAKVGWRVVATIDEEFGDGTYLLTLPKGVEGLRKKWAGSLGWWPPFQYITNGPQILSWDCQNICSMPSGEWWRPDMWEYRARLHVAADVNLRSVTIYDGDRGVFRRWQPQGKEFQTDLVLAHNQQRDLVVVVEDVLGRKAISMELWNRTTMLDQFICGDRCNFLGRAYVRTRDGRAVGTPVGFRGNLGVSPSKGSMDLVVEPAVSLTLDAPTLPIDGKPFGFPTTSLKFEQNVPGEYATLFSFPGNYLMSPEIAVGQGNYVLAYDPAEAGVATTPLGHPYKDPEKQFQIGKNAWTSLYRLIPTKKLSGWSRIYACNWLPEELRIGWLETQWTLKEPVQVDPAKGIQVMYTDGMTLYQQGKVIATPDSSKSEGAFRRGTYALSPSAIVMALDDRLTYRYEKGRLTLVYLPGKAELAKGEQLHFQVGFAGAGNGTPLEKMLAFADKLGISTPGQAGYAPKFRTGKQLDNYLQWRVQAEKGAVEVKVPKAAIPAFLPVSIEGLHDGWSVFLLDRARKAPNFRPLPIRDGRAFAQLDLNEADSDLFLGHPVTCDKPEVTVQVAWKSPGVWQVEAHNPGTAPVKARLQITAGWNLFRFNATVTLPAGSSQMWEVKER